MYKLNSVRSQGSFKNVSLLTFAPATPGFLANLQLFMHLFFSGVCKLHNYTTFLRQFGH